MKKMNNKGFSLVELIIVIAIMAILIAVLAPQYIKYVEKSRESADLDNWQAVVNAIQVAYADVDNPVSGEAGVKCGGKNNTLEFDGANKNSLSTAFEALGTDISGMKMKSDKYATATITAKVSDGIVTLSCTNTTLNAQLGLK